MPHFCVSKKLLKLIEKFSFFLSFMVYFDMYWIYDSRFFLLRYKLLKWSVWGFALKWHGFCRHAIQPTKWQKTQRYAKEEKEDEMLRGISKELSMQCASIFVSWLLSEIKRKQRTKWQIHAIPKMTLKSNRTHSRMKFDFILLANVCAVYTSAQFFLYIIKTKRCIKCNNNAARKKGPCYLQKFSLSYTTSTSEHLPVYSVPSVYSVYFSSEKIHKCILNIREEVNEPASECAISLDGCCALRSESNQPT